MAYLYACRHGQNEDNVAGLLNGHRDLPLTDLGRAQAQTLAKTFRDEGTVFDEIYSSPLIRAKETAEAIGLALNMKVKIFPEIIERDFGILSGKKSPEDIPKYATETLQGDKLLYFLSGEGVETFAQLYERASFVIQEMNRRHPGKKVLLVCHGDIMMMLRAVKRKMHWREALLHLPYIGNTALVDLEKEEAAEILRKERENF